MKFQKYTFIKRTFHPSSFSSNLKDEDGTGGGPLKSWSYFERSLTRNEFFLRGSERRDASSFRFACPHRSRACARVKRFSVKIKSEGRYGFSSRHSASRGVERPRESPISREKIHGCCIIHKERHLVAFFFLLLLFSSSG